MVVVGRTGRSCCCVWCFVFRYTATTEIYTLSLHDALPISIPVIMCDLVPEMTEQRTVGFAHRFALAFSFGGEPYRTLDRKSTRLNSSHEWISYAVFCLKKKRKEQKTTVITTHHTTSLPPTP